MQENKTIIYVKVYFLLLKLLLIKASGINFIARFSISKCMTKMKINCYLSFKQLLIIMIAHINESNLIKSLYQCKSKPLFKLELQYKFSFTDDINVEFINLEMLQLKVREKR